MYIRVYICCYHVFTGIFVSTNRSVSVLENYLLSLRCLLMPVFRFDLTLKFKITFFNSWVSCTIT